MTGRFQSNLRGMETGDSREFREDRKGFQSNLRGMETSVRSVSSLERPLFQSNLRGMETIDLRQKVI